MAIFLKIVMRLWCRDSPCTDNKSHYFGRPCSHARPVLGCVADGELLADGHRGTVVLPAGCHSHDLRDWCASILDGTLPRGTRSCHPEGCRVTGGAAGANVVGSSQHNRVHAAGDWTVDSG